LSIEAKNIECPECHESFGSKIEFQLHWSHNHNGVTPKLFLSDNKVVDSVIPIESEPKLPDTKMGIPLNDDIPLIPEVKQSIPNLGITFKEPLSEFLEYATPYLDGLPHKIEDLTRYVLKPIKQLLKQNPEECTPIEILQRLEKIILNLPNMKHIEGDNIFTLVDVDDEKDRSLSESIKTRGALSPVFFMADGVTVVDGRHRLAEMPNYPFTKIILKDCTTRRQAIIDDLILNCNRRVADSEERRQKIVELTVNEHLTVNEIKEATGLGYSTIRKYVPQEFKNQVRAEAGKASWKIRTAKALEQEPITVTPIAISPITETPITETEVNDNFDNFVRSVEQPKENENPAVSVEAKVETVLTDLEKEQLRLEKLIKDAECEAPESLKRTILGLASDSLLESEVTQQELNKYLSVTFSVLFDYVSKEGKLEELLETAKGKW
jgi:hypothetical protein